LNRRLKYALGTIGVIWIIGMIAFTPEFVALHRETQAVKQSFADFGDSLVRQQFDVAYSYCGTQFREATPYGQFVNEQEDLASQYGALKSVERKTYQVHGKGHPTDWRASIDAALVYAKKTVPGEFVFDIENDRWVLYGFELAGGPNPGAAPK
jgi:hypothetical protein